VPQPASGTVTFLFTDIEGSTRLWEERAGEMRALVAQHDERFRAAIERNGRYVFATGGDGFAAAIVQWRRER
jgi:class 3 adenylate cyclase